jgi:hypothetical protein
MYNIQCLTLQQVELALWSTDPDQRSLCSAADAVHSASSSPCPRASSCERLCWAHVWCGTDQLRVGQRVDDTGQRAAAESTAQAAAAGAPAQQGGVQLFSASA